MQVLQSVPENSVAYQSALETLEAEPEIPFYLEHILEWFWELNSRRTAGGFSHNPITWTDLGFWNMLKNKRATPIEIEIIEIIDRLYLKYINEKSEKGSKEHGNIPNKKSKKR